MARLTWQRVVALAVIVALASWSVNMALGRSGSSPAPMPWSVPVVLATSAAAVLWLGWTVRQYRSGKRPALDPLQAARTAMFSQAAAYAGAALVGAYAGYVLALLGDWGHEPRRAVIIVGALAALASAGLCAAGWIAERWCATDDGDAEPPPSSTSIEPA